MLDSLALIIFPAAMILAALSDLFTMKIPNRLSLLLVGAYFPLALYLGAPLATIGWHASAAAAMLVLTFILYSFAWIGGGDAKLAAATALWLGWGLLAQYGMAASLLGGALTLAILELRRHDLPQRLLSVEFVAKLADKSAGVPYGVALACAALAVYPQSIAGLRLVGV
jgi:prepilin peptidase CpaA